MATHSGRPFNIAIIGGGITGLTLAIALLKRGVPCTVYEQSASFREIGAGVGLHAGAVAALGHCDPAARAGFERVCTVNAWPSKRRVWFDVFDGTADVPAKELRPEFTIANDGRRGGGSCHRARFLDELVGLLPADGSRKVAEFGKRLERIEQDDGEKGGGGLRITFTDGSVALADAVVGCDGIKSRTREILLGDEKRAKCSYSRKYAYRCLIPMPEAVEALGEEKAANTSLWVSPKLPILSAAPVKSVSGMDVDTGE